VKGVLPQLTHVERERVLKKGQEEKSRKIPSRQRDDLKRLLSYALASSRWLGGAKGKKERTTGKKKTSLGPFCG